jgi:acyl-CoA thioester hydrolase
VTAAEGWPFSHVDHIRYGDLDANRHLNNVIVLQFFESARIAYMQTVAPEADPTDPEHGTGFIFAEAHVNYRSPGFYEEPLRTFIRPSHLRRSSVRLEFRMVCDTDDRLIAEGWGTIVGYDYRTHRAAPIPAALAGRQRDAGAADDDTPKEILDA